MSIFPSRFLSFSGVIVAILLDACKPQSVVVLPPDAAPVTVQVITPQRIAESIILDGTIVPSRQVNLIARVSGNLEQLYFKDGQWVKQGDLLFTIEPGPYRDQLRLSQAKLEQAKSDYARQSELLREKANSETNVEISLSNLRQAEANFDIAKNNLSYTQVRAPFTGVIGKHLIDPGNYVGATAGGSVIASLIQITPIFVNSAVGENDAIRIRQKKNKNQNGIRGEFPQLAVRAQLQGETAASQSGTLDFVDHQLNQTSGTVALRASFPNQEHHLIPGFYAKLTIESPQIREVLVVPKAVIQTDQQGDYLYIIGGDKLAHRQNVQVSMLQNERVEILKGLNPGDLVVTEGYGRLSEGHAVEVLDKTSNTTVGQP